MSSFPHLLSKAQQIQSSTHAGGFWARHTARQEQETQLQHCDRDVLGLMFKKHYLPTLPKVHYGKDRGASEVRTSLDGWGNITINTNDRELDRWKDQVDPVLMRWFILLHEASHCVFDVQPQKLQTSSLPTEQQDALNAWVFNTVFRGFLYRCLNEAFADTYAVMMMLQQDKQSARVQKIAMDIQAVRHHLAQEENDDFEAKQSKNKNAKPSVYLACEASLVRALGTQDQWIGLEPTQLLQQALQCASDGLMDAMKQYAHTAAGQYLVNSLQGFPEYRNFISMYAIEMSEHTEQTLLHSMGKIMGAHPGWDFVQQLCHNIRPIMFEQLPWQQQAGKYAAGQMDAEFCDYIHQAQTIAHTSSQMMESHEAPQLKQMMEAWQSDLVHQLDVMDQLRNSSSKLAKNEQKRGWVSLRSLTAGMK